MPAPLSSIASLLTWLPVVVFLLAGAPAQRQAGGPARGAGESVGARDGAKNLAAAECGLSGDVAPRLPVKARDQLDAPASFRFAAPDFILPRALAPRSAALFSVRWLSIVGLIELRL